MGCYNATHFIDWILELERRFAGSVVLCPARQLASRLTVFVWRLTFKPQAGFNKKVALKSTFNCIGS